MKQNELNNENDRILKCGENPFANNYSLTLNESTMLYAH